MMKMVKREIDGKYEKYIKSIIDKPMKNAVFIFDTILDQQNEELNIHQDSGDLLLGKTEHL